MDPEKGHIFYRKYILFIEQWNNGKTGSFTLGNFGYGNKTWNRFAKWLYDNYGVTINPSAQSVRLAKEELEL